MGAQVNMARLLAQPQQTLQLDYRTAVTQNHQKIKLYGSPTTKELKKSHSSRQVGGAETGDTRRDAEMRKGGPIPEDGE